MSTTYDIEMVVTDQLAALHPDLPAAIGHAMAYCIEDGSASDDMLLVDPDLMAAAKAFYPIAQSLTLAHPNVALYCDNCGDHLTEPADPESDVLCQPCTQAFNAHIRDTVSHPQGGD